MYESTCNDDCMKVCSRRRLGNGWQWFRNDVRAVDKIGSVVANDSELGHRALEVRHHQLLVVYRALPLARSTPWKALLLVSYYCLFRSTSSVFTEFRESV